ncbi:uncharacterized protein LOC105695576 isoform X2 [Orussus abietinus]|uniref:uncharacterized protein LOC105695576 isoform X2 n=1 Tax=Orussus abietinus TaxID=222816 RepID=UPI000626BB28|nr:uncharacterized protein LOC105695576 isoform X2 [Orussus abietinus]
MAQLIGVKLSRFDGSPWGFRLQGGKDFGTPLIVQKVNGGSPAEAAGLRAGDSVVRVNGTEVFNLRHKDAQDVIVRAGNSFELTVQRGGSTWKPSVSPVTASIPSPQPSIPASSIPPVTKTSLAPKKQEGPLIGSGHNFSPKPFLNGTGDGSIKSIVNKQYNSPVGIYSEETIAETLSAQAEVLAGGVLGVNFKKNEKNYNAQNSEVFKMVQEADKEPKSPEPVEPTAQSGVVTPSSPALTGLRPVSAPETKPQPTTPQSSLPPGQNICADCERLIVGVFVRIKDKNLHVECFKCSTCGTSLKNVGYYNINNKLYCDIHAKLVARQNAPAGLAPVTVPPGGRTPAGTISAALPSVPAPGSPSLNSHSSPQPFSACHRSSPVGSRATLRQRPPRPTSGVSYSDTRTLANGTSNGVCGSKTYTSTLTIRTCGEVGSTNGSVLASDSNRSPNRLAGTKETDDLDLEEPDHAPKVGEVCEIFFNPVIDDGPPASRTPKTYTSMLCQPTRLGTSPVNPPSLRPVQAPTGNNIGGPKPFGSSAAPISPPLSSGNTLPRPQSQTAGEGDYRERSSVKSKTLVWPPTKPIEEVTYPTASPLYVDPNPEPGRRRGSKESERIRRRRRHSFGSDTSEDYRERTFQREASMESVDRPGQTYRRVETVKEFRREQSRSPSSRPSSRESFRRSLTPTRIAQPMPRPWTATVTTGVSVYEPPPRCATVCRHSQVCQREGFSGTEQRETRWEEHRTERVQRLPEPVPCTYVDDEPRSRIIPVQVESRPEVEPPDANEDVQGEHKFYTETTEEDEGDVHVKRTVTVEKTVQRLDREEEPGPPVITEIKVEEVDREVENISDRRTVVDSADLVSSVVETQRLVERVAMDERADAIRIQEAEEKRKGEKKVCFTERQELVQEESNASGTSTCRTTRKSQGMEQFSELTKEVEIRQRELEEQRLRSLREQVEVHQSLREQQAPERRQTFAEKKVTTRYGPVGCGETTVEKKHVQFVKQTEEGPQPLSPVKNVTPKEWKSEMVRALTTAPDRPFSPFSACSVDDDAPVETYTREVVSERTSGGADSCTTCVHTCRCTYRPAPPRLPELTRPYCPAGEDQGRASPLTEALTTAPERPYTPLGRAERPDEVRTTTETRTVRVAREELCHPAEILYADSRSCTRKERTVCGKSTPQPLPTPPADFKLRDSSPVGSRPVTPGGRPATMGLRKPDTIPAYQRNLVCLKKGPVDTRTFVPSRTPTPTPGRCKSPAQGPPEPPACYVKAQAPRIRDDPPPPRCPAQVTVESPPKESVTYHFEEDIPGGHRVQDLTCTYGESRVSVTDDGRHRITKQESERKWKLDEDVTTQTSEQIDPNTVKEVTKTKHVTEHFVDVEEEELEVTPLPEPVPEVETTCTIRKVTRVVPCPAVQDRSERFPRTGVRVLPPCPPPCETTQTRVCRKIVASDPEPRDSGTSQGEEVCRKSVVVDTCRESHGAGGCQRQLEHASAFRETRTPVKEPPPSDTGVSVLPYKSGDKAGVVVVPCDGPLSSSEVSGVCVVPTPDRSGLCISPCKDLTARSCGRSSGRSSVDLGISSRPGVKVSHCSCGSVCVGPCVNAAPSPRISCTVTKVSTVGRSEPPQRSCTVTETTQSVRCSGRVEPEPCPHLRQSLPFPQIPLPYEKNSQGVPPADDLGFEPIREPRTNLGNQLTLLTAKRDKPVVQLYKPQVQTQTQTQTESQTLTEVRFRSSSVNQPASKTQNLVDPPNLSSLPDLGAGGFGSRGGSFAGSTAPTRGRGILNQAATGPRVPLCGHCNSYVRGPFITALGQIWCPDHFICVNSQCRRPLHEIGFVEEKGQLHCEYCFERFIAPNCYKCNSKIKGDCLNAIGKHFHPECFNCCYCGKLFGNSPFFLEDGSPYCENDWNELFTTKCFACGFPVEAGDRWVEALNNNYHSQCFNCTMCKKNLEGQSFYAKGGRPFCKTHAR